MKRTDGFDARRLRPRQHRSLASRLGAALGLLLIIAGLLMLGAGAASFLDDIQAFASMSLEREAALTLITLGAGLFLLGLLVRSRVRRHLHEPSGLSMSPRLKKRR
jgi:uncharacterized membrane protein YidH (DUF202 family)